MPKDTPMNDFVWTEELRPARVKEMILPKYIKDMMLKFVEEGQTTHLLLTSLTPGTGKTSLAQAIIKDLGAEHMMINMSNEGNIATLRDKVLGFAKSKAFNNKPKVVLLDEMGGASSTTQAAFKAMSEELTSNCRFIMTENELHKIIPPLREGRFIHIDFDWKDKVVIEELKGSILKRLKQILQFKEIEFEEKALVDLINSKFPSIRIMLSTLQSASIQYGRIDERMTKLVSVGEEFINLFFAKNLTGIRQYVKECNLDERYMYKELFDKVVPKIEKKNQAMAIYTIAEHEARITNFPEIQLASCILELFKLV